MHLTIDEERSNLGALGQLVVVGSKDNLCKTKSPNNSKHANEG